MLDWDIIALSYCPGSNRVGVQPGALCYMLHVVFGVHSGVAIFERILVNAASVPV